MSTPTHTPGPWMTKGTSIFSGSRYIGSVNDWSNPDCSEKYRHINQALKAESEANARLIASAPALKESHAELMAVIAQIEDEINRTGSPSVDGWDKARAALAKAKRVAP